MKVLIDTNIALDVLLKRVPYYETSARVLVLSEKSEIDAYVSASAITDIYYITHKALKDKHATIKSKLRAGIVLDDANTSLSAVAKGNCQYSKFMLNSSHVVVVKVFQN